MKCKGPNESGGPGGHSLFLSMGTDAAKVSGESILDSSV